MASAKMNKKGDEEFAENIDRKETLKFKYEKRRKCTVRHLFQSMFKVTLKLYADSTLL